MSAWGAETVWHSAMKMQLPPQKACNAKAVNTKPLNMENWLLRGYNFIKIKKELNGTRNMLGPILYSSAAT